MSDELRECAGNVVRLYRKVRAEEDPDAWTCLGLLREEFAKLQDLVNAPGEPTSLRFWARTMVHAYYGALRRSRGAVTDEEMSERRAELLRTVGEVEKRLAPGWPEEAAFLPEWLT